MRTGQLPLLFVLLFSCTSVYAELVELGLSGNYRRTFLADSDTTQSATDEAQAYTFSIAYYLREMTALEFSFTSGESERSIPSTTISSITKHTYNLLGADLVFTFGKREERFVPYIKAGLGYFINKRITYTYINHTTPSQSEERPVELDPTVVPSVGFGMRTLITKSFAIKAGIEIWTSGPVSKSLDEFDWAARIGLSWFL